MLRSASSLRYIHHVQRLLKQRSTIAVVVDLHHNVIVRSTLVSSRSSSSSSSTVSSSSYVAVVPVLGHIQKKKRIITTRPYLDRYLPCHRRVIHTKSSSMSTNTGSTGMVESSSQVVPMTLPETMSYYQRTVTFSNSIYQLYLDYLLYQNIHDAFQTASTGNQHDRHAWTQRYHVLCDPSRRLPYRSNNNNNNNSTVTKSAVALILQQQQRNTYRYAPNLMVPYRAQEQQYQFIQAIQKVTPTVILCMIPLIGYVPMLLAILLPRQLLCSHFYNHYEILYYNMLQYQQRIYYYNNNDDHPTTNTVPSYLQRTLQKYQQPQQQLKELSSSNWTSIDDVMALYRWCVTTTTTSNDIPSQTDETTTHHFLHLPTYPRDALIHLALATGICSTTITNHTLQYYIATYCIPTFLLQHHIHSTVQRIVKADQMLLCEEYLASMSSNTSNAVSSFVETSMTDIELSNACLLRGLPTTMACLTTNINGSPCNPPPHQEQMCQSLKEHLNIVASLLHFTKEQTSKRWSTSSKDVDDNGTRHHLTDQDMEQIGLFLLHLPLIRSYLSKYVR